MYRTARGAFESFDETLAQAGKLWDCQTPLFSGAYGCLFAGREFWPERFSFARALGEYGATSMLIGYTPGRTATISTTVYQLWRTDNDTEALRWVLVNIAISAVFLLAVNLLEARQKRAGKGGRR